MERTDHQIWRADDVARLLALAETEKRLYQRILSVVPLGLAVVSAGGEVVAVNRSFRRLLQLLPDDAAGKSIHELLPSDLLRQRLGESFLGTAAPDPVIVERLAGRFETQIFPLFPPDEAGAGKVLVMVRESQRTEAAVILPAVAEPETNAAMPEPEPATAEPAVVPEAVLRIPEPPAPVVAPPQSPASSPAPELAGLPAVVWTARRATREFLSVSGSAAPLFGAPNDAWLGDPRFFGERVADDDRARVLEFCDRSFLQPGEYTCEYRARNGRWIRETIRVDADTLTGVATDITERRQLEAQVLQSQRVDAATQLSSRLAHDLNNPLMIITGYGEELFSSLVQDHPMRHDIEEMLGAAERMARITAKLTEFTRPKIAEASPVDLIELLAAHGGELAPAIVETAEAPLTVMAHPEALVKALTALLAAFPDRSRVRLSAAVRDVRESLAGAPLAAGQYAALRLKSEGPAVPAAAFDAFLTARDAALAYLTIRSWGGDIACAAEGVTVLLCLAPIAPAAAPEPVPEPAPAPAALRETILLVEDEGGIRALVRKILKREGYHVLEAASGEEAVRTALSHIGRIDLLVSDMTLPGISGRQVADQLRQSLPHLKALFISGFSEDRSVYEAELAAGTAFLQKPFTLGALLSKVRGVIDAKAQ